MTQKVAEYEPRILIISTLTCAYPGADNAGQLHLDHNPHAYNLRVMAPVIFPEEFYVYCFEQGFDGIIVMACGEECPYPSAYKTLAKRLDKLYEIMKNGSFAQLSARVKDTYKTMGKRGISSDRLKLTAICTVCAQSYVREINEMTEKLKLLPPIKECLSDASQGGN